MMASALLAARHCIARLAASGASPLNVGDGLRVLADALYSVLGVAIHLWQRRRVLQDAALTGKSQLGKPLMHLYNTV